MIYCLICAFGDIDILIGALRSPAPKDDVVQEALFSSNVVIVARPDHPLVSESQVTLDQLKQSSWVLPRSGAPTRTIFNQVFEEAGCHPPEKIIESNSHILIRSLLWDSDRLTLISEHQVHHEISKGLLAIVPFTLHNAFRPIGMTTRKDWHPTNRQKDFLDILRHQGHQLDRQTT